MLKHSQQGIGLIEVMLALFILSVGILSLMYFQMTVRYNEDIAKQATEAIFIAEQDLETQRNYTVIATTAGAFAYADIVSGTSTVTGSNTTFTLTRTVTANTVLNYKTVSDTVSWTDRKNIAQSINLTTIIASIDPANEGTVI